MRLQQERAQIEKAIQRDRQREKDKAVSENIAVFKISILVLF